jgi:cysteinyl-tRNA synthetase
MLGAPSAWDADERARDYHGRFMAAVDDDLDLPAALVLLHDALSDTGVPPGARAALVASWDEILGLRLAADGDLDAELDDMVRRRDEARANKDYATADRIRNDLQSRGVELFDAPEGTRWVRR